MKTLATDRCCCGILSIKTGARIVASMMMVFDVTMHILEFLVKPPQHHLNTTDTVVSIKDAPIELINRMATAHSESTSLKIASGVAFALDLFVTIQVFIACKRNRAMLVVPMLIITILWMIMSIVILFGCAIVLIQPDLMKELQPNITVPIKIKTLFATTALCVHGWIFTVLKDCYIYLREIEGPRAKRQQNSERTTRF